MSPKENSFSIKNIIENDNSTFETNIIKNRPKFEKLNKKYISINESIFPNEDMYSIVSNKINKKIYI